MPQTDTWWEWSREYEFQTDVEQSKRILSELLTELGKLGWDDNSTFGIHLAVEEGLMNAIKHGNARDPSKLLSVTFRVSATRAVIEITDQGSGFSPEDVPDCTAEENLERTSGRGLMLMKNFMSSVKYNDIGNQVYLEKTR